MLFLCYKLFFLFENGCLGFFLNNFIVVFFLEKWNKEKMSLRINYCVFKIVLVVLLVFFLLMIVIVFLILLIRSESDFLKKIGIKFY